MRIVLDTNVLVSALIRPLGKPARVLDLILNHQAALLVDDRIVYEYREVLKRDRFGLNKDRVEEICFLLENISVRICCFPSFLEIPDPDDLPFLEVALSGEADCLVTGNKRDFGKPPKKIKIVSPDEYLKYFKNTLSGI